MHKKYTAPLFFASLLLFAQEPRPLVWNNEIDSMKLSPKKETSYRFETHGKTKLDFNLEFEKGSDLNLNYEIVKLPSKPTEKESVVSRSLLMKSQLNAELEEGGVYELRLKNSGSKPTRYTFRANCTGECTRPSVKLSDYVKSLTEGSVEAIGNTLEQKLKEFGIEEPKIASTIKNRDFSKLDTLATVQRLSDIIQIAPMVTLKDAAPKADTKLTGKLSEEIIRSPVDLSTAMVNVTEKPVAIQWGHHYSHSYTKNQIDQSEGLAKVLTALSVDNGSSVTVTQGKKEKSLTSPEQVMKYLLETGHEIRVDFEKVNANFLAFASGDTNILFPTWVKTGVMLPSGKELTVPMNHNQIVWKISGPLVNARVSAYHGIGGVGFTPVTDERPDWAKAEVKNLIDSKNGDTQAIIKSAEAAKNMIRLNRCERETIAKGAPADGYGLLGVCNDSTAYILSQLKLRKDVKPLYPYPMVRSKELNDNSCKKTDKDPYATLPHDADDINPDKIKLLERILAGVPRQADGSPMLKDAELISQIKEAEELLVSLKSAGRHDNKQKISH